MSRIYYATMESPVGTLRLVAEEMGLRMVWFVRGRKEEKPDAEWKEDAAFFADVMRQLNAYFAGELREFEIPLLMLGTEFQKRVWKALLTIPYGETMSYGELAKKIGCEDKTGNTDEKRDGDSERDGLHSRDGGGLWIFFTDAARDHGRGGKAEAESYCENKHEQRFREADGGDGIGAETANPEDIDNGEERLEHHLEDHRNGEENDGAI